MKKADFIRKIADHGGYSLVDVRAALDVIQEVVFEAMKADEEVPIIDGVKLSRQFKASHEARNPMTGTTCTVPDKYHPKCKFGTAVKNAIN